MHNLHQFKILNNKFRMDPSSGNKINPHNKSMVLNKS